MRGVRRWRLVARAGVRGCVRQWVTWVNADCNENDSFPLQKAGVALVIYILPGLGMYLQSGKREPIVRGEMLLLKASLINL